MTREQAIAILQEEIDGNLELSLREWEERDEQKLFPAIRMAIEALEKEPKTGEWIPCSERLPEKETDVLVTRTFLGCKDGRYGRIPPKTYVEVAQYFNGEWTALSDEYKVEINRHTNPVAWMPLPKPYREDGE